MTETRTFRTFRGLLAAVLGASLWGFAAVGGAAVPVEESRGSSGERLGERAAPRNAAAGGGSLSALFYELQILQQEVQDLRGMLEEQNHRLERLARDQQEQYLDLDRRMQALRRGGGGSEASAGADSGSGAAGGGGQDDAEPAGPPGSEREAYSAAFDLMKNRQFDESVAAFNALIEDYPNGAYTPNAFYWLGELHLAQDQIERARQSFAQVINLYPDHQKVPDALYKLGVVYHRLGDVERAREYLNQVRREHARSSAAGLAASYLAEL